MSSTPLDRFSVVATPQPNRLFGYDAIEDRQRRKAPVTTTKAEDAVLTQPRRRKLTATARELGRSYSLFGWMLRKHLDYVSQFTYRTRTEDDRFNAELDRLMHVWFRPANCDVAGRHPFPRLIRLCEARRTVDGDVGLLKLADGRLQAIEGDRIRNPDKLRNGDSTAWTNGVKTNKSGRALAYAIFRRKGNGFEFERTVSAARFLLHGYFDRFDQLRGISPIATAINPLRDVYEAQTLAIAKAKVAQLFAMVVTQQAEAGIADTYTPTADADGDGTADSKYTADFGRGPIKLELEPGDDAKFLESSQPSSEFQAFTEIVLQTALAALDLPPSFLDASKTNFFGSRAAWIHYERSCRAKRADVQELLRKITVWRLQLWIQDGTLRLPRGMTLGSIPFEWTPLGVSWMDKAKELRGDVAAIAAGLDNPQRICKERGTDFQDNIAQTAAAIAAAKEKGLTLSFAPMPQPKATP